MPPLFPLTLSLYAVGCTLVWVMMAQPGGSNLPKVARLVLSAAFLTQAVDIGWLCFHGHNPVSSSREALFFAAWLINGLYLLLQLRYAVAALGSLAVPVILLLLVLTRLAPAEVPAVKRSLTTLGTVHILCASLGSAIFAVAAGTSALYLIMETQLKRHHRLRLLRPEGGGERGRALSLEGLDTLNRRCVQIGFPVFTAAIITGTVWIQHLEAFAKEGRSPFLHPQYVLAVAAWLVYGWLMLLRLTLGARGRRAALLTLAGFATTLAVMLTYLFRGVFSTGGGAGV